MACPITIAKFVGTISLGLLTGLSYTVSNIAVPALQALPTASNAGNTLKDIQARTRRRILRFSNLAAISLVTAFTLSSPRRRHPYLIWTSLVALIGGGGIEWYTGQRGLLASFTSCSCHSSAGASSAGSISACVPSRLASYFGCGRDSASRDRRIDEDDASNGAGSEIEIVEERDTRSSAAHSPAPEDVDVNGEGVQQAMSRERTIQRVRTWILGVGFSMGVVGIWGDGA